MENQVQCYIRVFCGALMSIFVTLQMASGQRVRTIHESFDHLEPTHFLTEIPNKNTQIRNGVLWTRGESGGKYPPMVELSVEGRDLEISFRYRHLESGGMVWFFVDGDDGFGSVDHMLRVKLNRTGVQLQIDSHSLDPNHPERKNSQRAADRVSGAYRLNSKLPPAEVDLSANVWRRVKLVFHGNTVTISVDGESWVKTIKHTCFNAAKRKLLWMQRGGEKGIEIDDIKVSETVGQHSSEPITGKAALGKFEANPKDAINNRADC